MLVSPELSLILEMRGTEAWTLISASKLTTMENFGLYCLRSQRRGTGTTEYVWFRMGHSVLNQDVLKVGQLTQRTAFLTDQTAPSHSSLTSCLYTSE
jgi:hypothetical protein